MGGRVSGDTLHLSGVLSTLRIKAGDYQIFCGNFEAAVDPVQINRNPTFLWSHLSQIAARVEVLDMGDGYSQGGRWGRCEGQAIRE
jgi:hypothetical protein